VKIPHPKTLPCAWPLGCGRMAHGYDHDHDTDQVRAPLCKHHNVVLRDVGDTAASLRAVADWIETASMGFTYHEATLQRKNLFQRDRRQYKRVRYASLRDQGYSSAEARARA
jgi:hypothetical protein